MLVSHRNKRGKRKRKGEEEKRRRGHLREARGLNSNGKNSFTASGRSPTDSRKKGKGKMEARTDPADWELTMGWTYHNRRYFSLSMVTSLSHVLWGGIKRLRHSWGGPYTTRFVQIGTV